MFNEINTKYNTTVRSVATKIGVKDADTQTGIVMLGLIVVGVIICYVAVKLWPTLV